MADSPNSFNWIKQAFVVISIAVLAYIYMTLKKGSDHNRLQNVLNGLLAEERSVNVSTNLGIAVGFGSCLDIFVDGIHLMNNLGVPPPSAAKYHENIENLEHVAEMFAFFLSKGAAAERYIPLPLFEKLVKAAEGLNGSYWAPGGNAPVISKRFALEGFTKVTIGGHASKRFKSLYSTHNVEFSEEIEMDDDIHLIFEFKVNDHWGPYKVTRANRFILHSDQTNPLIKSLESFEEFVKSSKPRLVVIGAMQMLDNYPFEAGVREERMGKLQNFLRGIPESTLIHFEMASFSESAMMLSLLENVFPFVDSLGMNEQELPNILSMLKHNDVIQVADSNPRTAIVLDDIRELYKVSKIKNQRTLTRIHVHTLSFQVMLIKKGSGWRNTKAGASKASLVAHRHVCGVDEITVDKARLIMDDSFQVSVKENSPRVYFNETSPISCWDEDDYEICLAPVLVCTDVKQTAGGGDNITPAGLMLQI